MKQVKLIVMYPAPTDLATFERRYAEEHVPMAVEKLTGKTRFVASHILSNADQTPAAFHRIAEVYYPTLADLQASLSSPGGQETAQHAVDISTGGKPTFLISEVETFDF
jgi:uncharacterized protein (TIGR02118 family)